jgi:transcription elongation factor Elf1
MADIFHENGMEFKDYYPVEKCAKDCQAKYACPNCGHLEMRVKLIEYKSGWLFDNWTIECEKCGTRSEHGG